MFIFVLFLCLGFVFVESRRFKSDADLNSNPHEYESDLLAMSVLRQFNSECIDKKIPPEERFGILSEEWPRLVKSLRVLSQTLGTPLHEGFAISKLFRQMWAVYGFAVAHSYDLIQTLTQVVNLNRKWKWVDPYAGTGYLSMQVNHIFNVTVDAWDLKGYDQKWIKILNTDSTKQDINSYEILLLSYPCSQEKGCWSALERFSKSSKSKIVVYFGEPRGHCCGDNEMWEHLCLNWDLKLSRSIEKGLPGSYNYLMVFTKKIDQQNKSCNNKNNVDGGGYDNCIPNLFCVGNLCPQENFGQLLQFYELCEISRASFLK